MKFPSPENLDTLRVYAHAEIQEALILRGHCDCAEHDSCWAHLTLSLLEPQVEAFELPWTAAS